MAGATSGSDCTQGSRTSGISAPPSRGASSTPARSWTLARSERWTSTRTFWTSGCKSGRASCSEERLDEGEASTTASSGEAKPSRGLDLFSIEGNELDVAVSLGCVECAREVPDVGAFQCDTLKKNPADVDVKRSRGCDPLNPAGEPATVLLNALLVELARSSASMSVDE